MSGIDRRTLPQSIVNLLNDGVRAAAKDSAFLATMTNLGSEASPSSPHQDEDHGGARDRALARRGRAGRQPAAMSPGTHAS
ncbi:hypothetical protein [Paraburkholderia sp. 40]|uniref:hypothetical protein n=1 Tax=unclassified Paraburkholderia TaxID=2615204 RepID=UPI003D217666